MPIRIQRKRTKGWRMPPNTIYVGRPTKWGNPFTIQAAINIGVSIAQAPQWAADAYIEWMRGNYCYDKNRMLRDHILDRLDELHGYDLACWCPLEDKHGNHVPCHADILLEMANG